MSGAHEAWRNCADCGAPVPVQDLVRPWCGACGWNVTEGPDLPRSFIDRRIEALGQLHGAWLLNQVSASPEGELRPRLSVSVVLAFLVSFLILSTNVLIGLAGIYLIIWGWPHVTLMAGGVILLATSWFLRPHLGAMPKDCVARGDFPALFGLVDRIAIDLKIKPIEHVRIDEEFNASMAEIGLARAPLLTIGLPLWVSLTAAERVALIGHELAHRANHDPARSTIVGNGLLALDRWNYLLTPPRHASEGLGELMVHGVMFIVAKLTRGLRAMLASLLFIESQRAE
jgi:Zn-dependent protease with chaperone function